MKHKLNAWCCFIPIGIFAAHSLAYELMYGMSFFVKSLVLSSLPNIIYILIFFQLRKSNRKVGVLILLPSILILVCSLMSIQILLGNDIESALISSLAVHIAIVFVFAFVVFGRTGRDDESLLFDKETGSYFKLRSGKLFPLSRDEAKQYGSSALSLSQSYQALPSEIGNSISDGSSSKYSSPESVNSFDINSDLTLNPSSGSPMVGGIGGLDINGNSWGTNFNDPNNTYDPNRGY